MKEATERIQTGRMNLKCALKCARLNLETLEKTNTLTLPYTRVLGVGSMGQPLLRHGRPDTRKEDDKT